MVTREASHQVGPIDPSKVIAYLDYYRDQIPWRTWLFWRVDSIALHSTEAPLLPCPQISRILPTRIKPSNSPHPLPVARGFLIIWSYQLLCEVGIPGPGDGYPTESLESHEKPLMKGCDMVSQGLGCLSMRWHFSACLPIVNKGSRSVRKPSCAIVFVKTANHSDAFGINQIHSIYSKNCLVPWSQIFLIL